MVQKTKGEGSRCLAGVVLGARRGASIAPFIGGLPPLPRSLARAKDCGVVICSSKSTTHRPGESITLVFVLPLCLPGAATEVQYQ